MRVEWHCLPSWWRLSVPAARPTAVTTTNDPATTANAASAIAAAIVPTTFATGAAVTAFATATSNGSAAAAASSTTPAASAARATAWLSQYVRARGGLDVRRRWSSQLLQRVCFWYGLCRLW